ncbi:uncharacterized protein ACA1_036580 [Acanthamoeba castellanii str. Neff]|uniref:Retrovirus-related Pol polyprotein from transposon TNT 1-94-like beta-barrel domain-containing protein n=1 Tax=Acanthamoeba castellanii (strain ATCC 30010 / Neff) TaxID=1257118 RepID=L8HCP1_ACACF|nr:uncharacterized protein ACA1_036580 [Acanthamoeba castellanii str. Neff]ELR22965.1 hypothetical protein ACA1_036580 [Acanthamoeba castellanii str. Neff]
MTCHHKWLSLFNPKCSTHSVMLNNNATLAMRSSSDIQATIHIHNHPVTIALKGILYMPNLTKNLLSSNLITLDQLHLCMGHISTVWLR